jgi:hypothetical protein
MKLLFEDKTLLIEGKEEAMYRNAQIEWPCLYNAEVLLVPKEEATNTKQEKALILHPINTGKEHPKNSRSLLIGVKKSNFQKCAVVLC